MNQCPLPPFPSAMKPRVLRLLSALVLWLCLAPVQIGFGAENEERISLKVQFVSAQGKTYTTTVSKVDGFATFPLAVGEGAGWIMEVQKNRNEKMFRVSIDDPAAMRTGEGGRPHPLTVFSASFDVASGTPVTILKTDQYEIVVTLSVE